MADLFAIFKKYWLTLVAAAILAIWGFGMTTAFTKGMLDFIPNWAVFLMLAVPFSLLLLLGLLHPESRSRYHLIRTHPKKSFCASFVLVSAYIFIIWIFHYIMIIKPAIVASAQNPSKTWQPPELPPSCINVTVWFGTRRIDFPVWLAKDTNAGIIKNQ